MKISRIFRFYVFGLLLGFFIFLIIGMMQSRITEKPIQAAVGGEEYHEINKAVVFSATQNAAGPGSSGSHAESKTARSVG